MHIPLTIAWVRQVLAQREAGQITPEAQDRRAAVSIVLRAAPTGVTVLLIRRARHPRDPWSGHMAFPGGRQNPDDPDELFTAMRETREEVGLDLARDADLLGRLDDLRAIAEGRPVNLTISPFVFELKREPGLVLSAEVEEVVWAELDPIYRGDCDTCMEYSREPLSMKLPAWDVHGRIVWGLTHRMLSSLLEALASGYPPR
jgi:8-oxo-dGTP pyrophosphatase MutT (NUDIX family)